MMPQIRKRIAMFWSALLDKDEQAQLLRDLQEEEKELKKDLESEFREGKINGASEPLNEFYQSVLTDLHTKMGVVKSLPGRRVQSLRWIAAAAVLMILGSTTLLYLKQDEESFIEANATAKIAGIDSIYLFNNETKEKKALLADGSTVILSPGTKLSYPADYGEKQRTLHLQGSARFIVAHDSLRPFTVWAKGYTTTALGTEFTVDTREENRVHVALLTGKVVVKSEKSVVAAIADQYLLPGDNLAIDTHTGHFRRVAAIRPQKESSALLSKKEIPKPEGLLAFEETALKTVFETIAAKKTVAINSTKVDLDGLFFTGMFRENESVESMLRIVCQMNDFEFIKEANQVIIYDKKTKKHPLAKDSI